LILGLFITEIQSGHAEDGAWALVREFISEVESSVESRRRCRRTGNAIASFTVPAS
jgi:hypothetical protein